MISLLCTFMLSGATVTLPMEAEVSGTEIELGEIAKVSGADPDIVRMIEGIELGYAPAPGYSRLLKATRIREILTRKAPDVRVHLVGHSATRVKPLVQEIQAEEIRSAAFEELAAISGNAEVSFELSAPIPPVAVPAGRARYLLRARVDNKDLVTGAMSVPVQILVDGAIYRTIWTSWKVDVWRVVPVLVRAVRSGEKLHANMFQRSRVRWSGISGARPLPETQLNESIAARDLKAGETVTNLDVHRPTVLQLGEGIFLTVRKGAIRARVPAIALESGAVGDRVRVRTVDSSQELFARVLNNDVVYLDLGS